MIYDFEYVVTAKDPYEKFPKHAPVFNDWYECRHSGRDDYKSWKRYRKTQYRTVEML